ncbi:uracil-DNA glycosylase [Jeotgalibacillus proteolyticus]|uniref:Uracil-DNA glycosylase n=1 Tax=Jeotgalibacillus proteolyticus TaxID=2082395 RepID=A0A2S5G9W2_9BACL|nr:uracil-DNA glycosylase [Jeotgalibacillus proteolyticus]PPA69703.1 uracil-DNA glycosylase [Jeotgalibacillus proteolyticus]
MENKRINCHLCRHYYVTWDPSFPRGCRAHQFKTRELPSLQVFRASGHPCYAFEKKPSKGNNDHGRRV